MNKILKVAFWVILIVIAVLIGLRYTVGHSGLTIILGLLFKSLGERMDSKLFGEDS